MNEPSSTSSPGISASEVSEDPRKTREVNQVSWWRWLVLLPLSWLARIWAATLHFQISESERAWLCSHDEPLIQATWHNRLFIVGEVQRRFRPQQRLVALVSASRDGAWLAAFFKLLRIDTVRGSSSFRGMQATREMLAQLQSGADAGITPDGPRGPCYDLKPGILLLARVSNAPLLLYSTRFRSAWRLKSWDGFYLPKPFSTVDIRVRLLPDYGSLEAKESGAAVRELHQLMMELTTDT